MCIVRNSDYVYNTLLDDIGFTWFPKDYMMSGIL